VQKFLRNRRSGSGEDLRVPGNKRGISITLKPDEGVPPDGRLIAKTNGYLAEEKFGRRTVCIATQPLVTILRGEVREFGTNQNHNQQRVDPFRVVRGTNTMEQWRDSSCPIANAGISLHGFAFLWSG